MSNINSAYFIHIMPKIGGAKAPSAPPPVPTPMEPFDIYIASPMSMLASNSSILPTLKGIVPLLGIPPSSPVVKYYQRLIKIRTIVPKKSHA